MMDNLTKETMPNWVNPTLQGVAFWLGYKKQYFNAYHLTEGAIVGELTQLIASSISKDEKLKCEIMYKDIDPTHDGLQRLDLAIFERSSDSLKYAMEVKRFEASNELIEADLLRLYKLKCSNENIRCFLIIVSQNEFPDSLVTEEGNSKRINIIAEYGLEAYVRRTCKASSSFKVTNNANFASIIEVL